MNIYVKVLLRYVEGMGGGYLVFLFFIVSCIFKLWLGLLSIVINILYVNFMIIWGFVGLMFFKN